MEAEDEDSVMSKKKAAEKKGTNEKKVEVLGESSQGKEKQISSDELGEELIMSQSPNLQASNKLKGAFSSSNEKVYQISQSPLIKRRINKLSQVKVQGYNYPRSQNNHLHRQKKNKVH